MEEYQQRSDGHYHGISTSAANGLGAENKSHYSLDLLMLNRRAGIFE